MSESNSSLSVQNDEAVNTNTANGTAVPTGDDATVLKVRRTYLHSRLKRQTLLLGDLLDTSNVELMNQESSTLNKMLHDLVDVNMLDGWRSVRFEAAHL